MHTIQMLGLIGAASHVGARAARGMGALAWHRYAILAQPRAGLPTMPRGYAVRALVAGDLAGLEQAGQAIDAPAAVQAERFAALWAGVGQWMEARGLSHSLSRVADYNLPALTAHRRMGAQVLGHRSFLRIGGWQWSGETEPRLVRLGPARATAELDLGALAAGLG
ncbi:MAG: hypothetical protein RL339_381 [Pseudomonadota bacterium]